MNIQNVKMKHVQSIYINTYYAHNFQLVDKFEST
jgi:hypothetical protein